MSVPVEAETIEQSGGYELRWWAGVRSDGTLQMLSAEMQKLTGMEWAPIGENVIALALFGPTGRITTVLFPHIPECEAQILHLAKPWLQTLIQLFQAGVLPPDQYGQLL